MPPKKLKVVLYVLIFAFGFLGISLWSAWLVTHPTTIESGLNPGHFKTPFEEVALKTKDGVTISGWFIPHLSENPAVLPHGYQGKYSGISVEPNTAQKGAGFIKNESPKKPALVILHGYPAEKGDMMFIANDLRPDFNILLIDFRSFGKSGDSHTTLGNKERLDLEAALDFLESRGFSAKGGSASSGKKIGVLGFSLGGAVAIMTAAEDSRVAAVVSYASFADLTLLGQETYRRLFILRYPLVALMKFWGRIFWDVDAGLSPQKTAERLNAPVLIVHTKLDEQISFRHAELLRGALKHNLAAEFYFPAKGRHGELPSDFEERVKNFFLKHL